MKQAALTILFFILMTCLSAQSSYSWLGERRYGSGLSDQGSAITVDTSGNIFIVGTTRRDYYEYTFNYGNQSIEIPWNTTAYVMKLTPLREFVWISFFRAISIECNSITSDSQGNAYIAGTFEDSASFGDFSFNSSGWRDIFAAKIDPDGHWEWAVRAGGSGREQRVAIACNDINVYLTGDFNTNANFGEQNISSYGYWDIFISKLSTSGDWISTVNAGGSNNEYAYDICLDNDGDLIITGFYGSSPCQFGTYTLLDYYPSANIFVAKYDTNLSCLWAKKAEAYTSSTIADAAKTVTCDAANNIYIGGNICGRIDFGTIMCDTNAQSHDIFLAKMTSDGEWDWVQVFGSQENEYYCDVTCDDQGNAYITGCFYESMSIGSSVLTCSNTYDTFVAGFNSQGGCIGVYQISANDQLSYSRGNAIVVNADHKIYVTGFMYGSNSLGNIIDENEYGNTDAYIAWIGQEESNVNDSYVPAIINQLHQNYPNPFNLETCIRYNIKHPGYVNVSIFNIKGQLIRVLKDNYLFAGDYSQYWDGLDDRCLQVPSGVYYIKMSTDSDVHVVKSLFVK